MLTDSIQEARRQGCSMKEIAIGLGCPDQAYLNKVITTEKPAPRIPKLHDAPIQVQKAYVKKWALQLGMRVSDEDARAQAVAELVEACGRMLKEIA